MVGTSKNSPFCSKIKEVPRTDPRLTLSRKSFEHGTDTVKGQKCIFRAALKSFGFNVPRY